jgi:phosphatidylserine/phosphatidylglycerophosphate/cardiolipin synthase-like enzyme
MYLWHDDEIGRHFVSALLRAAHRGLRVRVLADANGASEVFELLTAVTDAGGDVREYSPFDLAFVRRYVHRTHKKLLLLDGRTAFSGGAGFSTHWSSGKKDEPVWHDRMFEIEGPVVDQLEEVFEADLSRWDPVGQEVPPRDREDFDSQPIGPSVARVLRGWPDARDFPQEVTAAVREAKERIWIGTPYFLPTFPLRRALAAAAERGVDVVVVHPSRNFAHPVLWYAVRARYGRWVRQGVRIHEFAERFYHAKLFVADRHLAIVGSSNTDAWSLLRNAEIDLAFTDEETVERIAAMFREDLARSRAVTPREASLRGGLELLKERFAKAIEHWL